MDPLQQMAVQAAIDASNDPTVRQALTQYRASGVLPQNEAALFALRAAYLSHGLPSPTMAAATGMPQAGHSVDPNAPRPIATPPPNPGDNSDPTMGFGPNRGGAQGVLPQTPTNSAPTPGYTPPDVMYATSTGGNASLPNDPGIGSQSGSPGMATPGGTNTSPVTPPPTAPITPPIGGGNVPAQPPMPTPTGATGGLGAQGLNTLYGDPSNQAGQQTALDQFLLSLGIDQSNPGLFGGALAKRLAGIFMNAEATGGIGGVGKNWGTDALGGMADLANTIRTQGMAGVQGMGQQVMAALPGLAGMNNSVADQQRLMNAALGLTSEGMNPYLSQGLAQQQSAAQTQFGRTSAGAIGAGQAPPTNYLTFLAGQQNPAYQGILNLLSGGGR